MMFENYAKAAAWVMLWNAGCRLIEQHADSPCDVWLVDAIQMIAAKRRELSTELFAAVGADRAIALVTERRQWRETDRAAGRDEDYYLVAIGR